VGIRRICDTARRVEDLPGWRVCAGLIGRSRPKWSTPGARTAAALGWIDVTVRRKRLGTPRYRFEAGICEIATAGGTVYRVVLSIRGPMSRWRVFVAGVGVLGEVDARVLGRQGRHPCSLRFHTELAGDLACTMLFSVGDLNVVTRNGIRIKHKRRARLSEGRLRLFGGLSFADSRSRPARAVVIPTRYARRCAAWSEGARQLLRVDTIALLITDAGQARKRASSTSRLS